MDVDKEMQVAMSKTEGDNHSIELPDTGVLVKPKWRGTSQDKADMQILGRHQVLRVIRHLAPTDNNLHRFIHLLTF